MPSVDSTTESVMRSYTGHGMIERHPAGLTIAGVMGHELGHVNEAQNLALAKGEQVVSNKIEINVEFENGRLVASSGKATTVTARQAQINSYKNTMDSLELENASSSNTQSPIKNAGQINKKTSAASVTPDNLDTKAGEIKTVLSQQKQKLESKLQQLDINNLTQAVYSSKISVASLNADTADNAQANAAGGAQDAAKALESNASQRQAAQKLSRIRQQIAKIDNMMASLKIAKSVQMLNGILQAVAGISSDSAADVPAASSGAGSGSSLTASVSSAGGNRKSSMENTISMIEQTLRGMVVNLSA